MGGHPTGADTPSPDPHAWMDEETIRDHRLEGGGAEAATRVTKTG
jgi:hypothetical protein